MANPSKSKGTRAETKVKRYLEGMGFYVDRRALRGSKDEGDLIIRDRGREFIVEVKAGKQCANPNRTQLNEWKRQTLEETKNSGAQCGYLVVVRYGRKIDDADCYFPSRSVTGAWHHFYLDQFKIGTFGIEE